MSGHPKGLPAARGDEGLPVRPGAARHFDKVLTRRVAVPRGRQRSPTAFS
ncbi:hypothetical protein ACWGKW_21415 [Streptomyces sp. NPDC054766]